VVSDTGGVGIRIWILQRLLGLEGCPVMKMYDLDTVRGIIRGTITYRKCPCCDNDGQEWWDGGTGLGAGPTPPVNVSVDDLASGDCDNCGALAYLLEHKE